MRFCLFLTAAFACSSSVALAQTVLPSGAVAPGGALSPSGATITPGTVLGSQPLAAPGTRGAGNPRADNHDETAPGMSHQDRRQLRRMSKPRSRPDGTMKPLPK